MSQKKKPIDNSVHRQLGVQFFNKIWDYLKKPTRTNEENAEMLLYANSSLLHWKLYDGCTQVNMQRGEYILAKAFVYAGDAENGDKYGEKCMKTTLKHKREMEDFDIAYGYQIVALAASLSKDSKKQNEYQSLAEKAADDIKDSEDKKWFLKDLKEDFEAVTKLK